MSRDPLAVFYTWPITVERYLGGNARGKSYDAPDKSLKAKVTITRDVVTDADGREVVTKARISLPVGTPTIPAESLVTLPERFGGAKVKVVAEAITDSGLPALPKFYRLDLS
ncbi:hypothetical protein HYG77_04770 [Rhodococcus sp. ZPP]|uniref:hypothetical protein n=1 Tax=Rhodococcus sp. ZPP TaxID=2749906 RepID=UPI001AD87732|nr:hypothetical protein [Rhodococcus sp. ZPP]QTJ64978.1 hypothetical protein HYG77_04770 [Rhodococcus sp. ZPP]